MTECFWCRSRFRNDYEWSIEQSSHYADVIQTATPISAGNSGGPLLSEDAKLIGVNTFGQTSSQGLNFAVSIVDIMQQLKVQRPGGLDALEMKLNQCGNKFN